MFSVSLLGVWTNLINNQEPLMHLRQQNGYNNSFAYFYQIWMKFYGKNKYHNIINRGCGDLASAISQALLIRLIFLENLDTMKL
jgi:hypothetical protein